MTIDRFSPDALCYRQGAALILTATMRRTVTTATAACWRPGTGWILDMAPAVSLVALPVKVFVLVVTNGVLGGFWVDARRRQGGCRDCLRDAASLAAVVERGDAPLPTPLLHGQPPPRMRPR